jgi:hypothetical protein
LRPLSASIHEKLPSRHSFIRYSAIESVSPHRTTSKHYFADVLQSVLCDPLLSNGTVNTSTIIGVFRGVSTELLQEKWIQMQVAKIKLSPLCSSFLHNACEVLTKLVRETQFEKHWLQRTRMETSYSCQHVPPNGLSICLQKNSNHRWILDQAFERHWLINVLKCMVIDYISIYLSTYLWLYSPLLDLGCFLSFLIFYAVSRTPWTGGSDRRKVSTCTQESTNTE